ncbi:glycoside hydrolase superfamily [Kickxella alabastrina]|uniref:glycoside hydrolase superfamily n=1 Tax=Kickxella alabastrina TaxID=61397 RepID=UPI00221F7578|nr:glycoside hydrolase superfamily [Kickxella alabastrina]KAI7830163.1 glycoside hydrolase superfamily [Kickxella alabastrina]
MLARICLLVASVAAVARASDVIFGYLPTWQLDKAAAIDQSKYTHLSLAFAIPDESGSISMENQDDILTNYTSTDRLKSYMVRWIKDYNFDGWDIDFEYPGRQGDSCHAFDPRLSDEFPDRPLDDVSAFAASIDFINIMLYDFNGVWSDTTGPNAPLDFAPGKGLQVSYRSSIQAWIDAGIPPAKINAGLPFYGRTTTAKIDISKEKDMYQPLNKQIPKGDGEDLEEADSSCGGPKAFSGVWKYRNLRSEGVLDSVDSAVSPWVRHFDPETITPWLFNRETMDFISYDDTLSISAKTQHAMDKGLAGVMVWPATNDYDNELLSAIYDTLHQE